MSIQEWLEKSEEYSDQLKELANKFVGKLPDGIRGFQTRDIKSFWRPAVIEAAKISVIYPFEIEFYFDHETLYMPCGVVKDFDAAVDRYIEEVTRRQKTSERLRLEQELREARAEIIHLEESLRELEEQ